MTKQALGRTIYLIEDNRQLLRALSCRLTFDGYTVEEFETADEALQSFDEERIPDLVLTDSVMPGKTQGQELALKIKSRHPTLPVILMSGYIPKNSLSPDQAKAIDKFIEKPLSLLEVSGIIGKVIGKCEAKIETHS